MVSLIYFGLSRIHVIVETKNKLFLFLFLPFALYFPSEWLESQERGNSQFTTLLLQTEGTVFLNPSLNRKIQRRKYVECENLCWRCEDLIHLKHFSLKLLQKEMLGMDRLHGRQAGNHTFLLAVGERQWITFFEKCSLFSERGKKKSTHRQEFAPKTPVPNKPTKILLQCLWERGSQLAEKQSLRDPCPCALVSLESSGCSRQCDFTAVGRWVQVLLCYSSPVWN